MSILFFILPETKDRTLEEVEELFMSEEYKRQHAHPAKYRSDVEMQENSAHTGQENAAYTKADEAIGGTKMWGKEKE